MLLINAIISAVQIFRNGTGGHNTPGGNASTAEKSGAAAKAKNKAKKARETKKVDLRQIEPSHVGEIPEDRDAQSEPIQDGEAA
ncbi:hypothetical protein OG930_38850 [Streptomyces sp. NBC_01799]|uniref:hypothetical protein n=1 Tax=Streptomyces sp. NBC_01800 TaxID=2975945 RepID=UPI002DDAD66A|nr:hypothetical protein [Streptomyces sp. NBC_01800]WSA72510.1 hypothetical protein OIE65_39465 [Streptomyces sp. NBC_01800]WSA81035.1 hypothetical protein OG930_38850 [Streptomyces sp. NBC_01799]